MAEAGGRYRGADRRLCSEERLPPGPNALRAIGLLAVALAAAVAVDLADPARGDALDSLLRIVRASAFAGAGLLCLVRWRVTGLTRPAFIGAALMTVGVMAESTSALVPLVRGEDPTQLPGRTATAAAVVAAVVLVVCARRAPVIDAGSRPSALLVVVAVAVPAACAGTALLCSALTGARSALPAVLPDLAMTGLWLFLAAAEWRARLERRLWLVPTVLLLAGAAALDAASLYVRDPADVGADVLALAAGAVALHGAAHDLRAYVAAQSSDLLRLRSDVVEHEDRDRTSREREAERLHEVRNVLAGLHGATATLRKYEDRLDPGVRRRLEDAVSAELRRLSHLIDPVEAEPTVDVHVGSAVAAVLAAEREQGADVRADLGETTTRGRAADVATILSVLLVNARRHAPGSSVDLLAESSDGETRLFVEDRGPGVPLDKRREVFERGERAGACGPGSGLGLYVAQRLAGEMGGTLTVDGRPGGGASFVLTLPSGSAALAGEQSGEDVSQSGEILDLDAAPVAGRGSVRC